MLATDGRQVRKKRHVATVPLISDANTSVRTTVSRRVQFPPLLFVNEGARTATKPCATRSHISENALSFGTENYTSDDHDICLEHVEKEVQGAIVEYMQLTEEHRMTNAEACCRHMTVTDDANSISIDELAGCPPLCLKSPSCKVDDDTASNHLPVGIILDVNDKDHTVAEKSPNLNQKQDVTMCAENTSGVHFDVNTPSCEVEPSEFTEGHHEPANEVEAETVICQNTSRLADQNSVEPLHVLSFSHLERSLDTTQDPVELVICAAELKENMSELHDRYDETSVNACADSQRSFFLDKLEFFSKLNSLTPLENRSHNSVLVSDTPVSDYGLSYRQRALKAGNIRLRYRTGKS